MPIIWRYLLRNYFQIFFLCVTGFISILLVTRMQEIARLATLNSEWKTLFLFTLCQIPYILPIAIPVSGLIASILLVQRLSHTHELTALRSSGLSIKMICAPLLMGAFLLATLNFVVAAEITPRCRLYSRDLIQNITTINPLFLMKKSKLLKLEDSYVDMKMTLQGKEAKEIIFAVKNQSNDRITLLTAKKFAIENNLMSGKNVTLISNIAQGDPSLFDHLIIENQKHMSTSATALSALMQKTTQKLGFEHLPLHQILSTFNDPTVKLKTYRKAQFELCRRLFFPCITFAFTFLGISLGMQIGRERKRTGMYLAILLSSITFICSIAAKSYSLSLHKVIFFYTAPFPLLLCVSYYFQKRVLGGIE